MTLSRAAASRGEPLTPTLLAGWQKLVLGVNEVHLRQGDAFAKGGRERYGLTPRTWQDFAACLRQSADPSVPLPARAPRAYLDIAFFPTPTRTATPAWHCWSSPTSWRRKEYAWTKWGRYRPPATRTTRAAPSTWRLWSPY
ncbi:hypothetical protein ACIG5E_37515 [Kitasatospora sp. NPDC053057]|uniref:hypothetical protein n=1 Tax=Kitasatospora sp. NPDC053057 TaxID=3364062 RepID=UPI0037CBC034